MTQEEQIDPGIHISEIRVQNYRSLKSTSISLDPVTILVGENNSGKTSLLDALEIALGERKTEIPDRDVFVRPDEVNPPRDRRVIIDILFRPAENDEFTDQWLALWGTAVRQDETGSDFLAIRVHRAWDEETEEHRTERFFLDGWPEQMEELEDVDRVTTENLTVQHVEPSTLYLLDAQRDITQGLRRAGSFWGRLVSEVEIEEDLRQQLEEDLEEIGEEIAGQSEVIQHLQRHLNGMIRPLATAGEEPEVSPVLRDLKDVNEGMDILFATRDSKMFPVKRHGMGTRSLSSLLVFRAYITWLMNQREDEPIHPLLALEEPETHLHPHAQQSTLEEILDMPGQRILTTHSPYIVMQADQTNIRHFSRLGPRTQVSDLGEELSDLDSSELNQIRQRVVETRGELAFAQAVILCEGETEEELLPILLKEELGNIPEAFGINVVEVGGHGYGPFIRFADALEIDWIILSDGENQVKAQVKNTIENTTGDPVQDPEDDGRVVFLPEGDKIETYLVNHYQEELVEVINDAGIYPETLDAYIDQNHGNPRSGGGERDYEGEGGRRQALIDALERNKTIYASLIGEKLLSLEPERRIPPKMRELFQGIMPSNGTEDDAGG